MKRFLTVATGVLILLVGLFGVWCSVVLIDEVATHILVPTAAAFAVLIAAGSGLMIRAFARW